MYAWVQVYLPEVGWRGFDPTNGILTQTDHVRVASGRSYPDATEATARVSARRAASGAPVEAGVAGEAGAVVVSGMGVRPGRPPELVAPARQPRPGR